MTTLAAILADTHRWNHMDGWNSGWMRLWGALTMAGFIALAVWLANTTRSTGARPIEPPDNPTDRARQIVAERYANGDITTEEYREKLDELDSAHSR